VCFVCPDQERDGVCERCEQAHCPVDAYLIPVVESIEEAPGRKLVA
jgi:hypothetical protein